MSHLDGLARQQLGGYAAQAGAGAVIAHASKHLLPGQQRLPGHAEARGLSPRRAAGAAVALLLLDGEAEAQCLRSLTDHEAPLPREYPRRRVFEACRAQGWYGGVNALQEHGAQGCVRAEGNEWQRRPLPRSAASNPRGRTCVPRPQAGEVPTRQR